MQNICVNLGQLPPESIPHRGGKGSGSNRQLTDKECQVVVCNVPNLDRDFVGSMNLPLELNDTSDIKNGGEQKTSWASREVRTGKKGAPRITVCRDWIKRVDVDVRVLCTVEKVPMVVSSPGCRCICTRGLDA